MSYTVGSTRVISTNSASGTTEFTFTFPYIKEDHIEVYKEYVKLNQGTGVSEYQVITNVSPKLIRLNTGTASANVRIEIRRNSSLDTPLVDYADGSTLTANDLDTSALQSLYIDQELKDSQFQTVSTSATTGHPTLNNNLLTEVADPINAQDAATKNYVATALKTDVSGGNGVSIADDQPLTGQIRVDLDANIATLRNMQTGASAKLAELTETELSILDEATVTTAELNTLDGITSDVNELNMLDGKSFRNSDGGAQLDTTSDTQIPSSKVIAAHVASSQLAIGGFITIADELSFPTTANMPKNGVVVSINNADGVIVNSSGVSVSGRTTDGTPATVTINGFPSSLYGETLAASTGLIVTATSTTNTYNYHKLLATESDIKQLSDTINDFHSRYRIASSDPVGTTAEPNDDGDLYWNTATNTMRVYEAANNAGWRDLVTAGETTINGLGLSNSNLGGGSSTFDGVNNNGTVTGTYRFQLDNVPSNAKASQFLVSIDGTIQQPDNRTFGTGESGVDNQPPDGFSITGNDIIFASPPLTNSPYFIITLGSALTIGAPSDNTVTSDKIVDGEIDNDHINASANIDGSKIADDTISEVKLDIHANPEDGQVLKWGTTNGMEWTEADPEGSNVKSTISSTENETADKVLKTNGSGGASWQVDGPVVTATASGDIAAGKPVVLNIDGTVSQIIDETKATLGTVVEVTDDTILNYQIVYDPNAEKIIVFWISEEDSGEGDEAIKYKVGTVNASANTIAFGSEQTVVSSIDFESSNHFDVVYNTASQRYLLVYSHNNIYARLIAGTYNSSNDSNQGGIDWGSAVNLSGDTSDSSNDEIYTANDLRFRLATATGTTDTRSCLVYPVGSSNNFFYNNVYTVGIKTNSSNNNLTISDRESLGPAGADEPSATSAETIINHIFDVAYDPDNEIFIAVVETDSGGTSDEMDCWSIVMNSDADITHTQKHSHAPSNDNVISASLAYDTDLKKFLLFFDGSSGNTDPVKARRIQVKDDGDGTYTLSQSNLSQTVTLDTISGALDSNAFYNPDTKELCYPYRYYTNQSNLGRIAVWERKKYGGVVATSSDSGGSSISYSTFRQLGTATNNNIGSAGDDFEGVPLCVYHTTAKKIVGIVKNITSPNEITARVIDAGTPYNFNNKYLGFSTSQCNNGNTATIAVSGNTVTIPTSTVVDNDTLVPAATYYIRGDGILKYSSGTTNEMDWIEAGFAISSTKLLIK